MGIERWYIAVVDGGRFLERTLSDPDFGINVQCPSYLRPKRRMYVRPNGDLAEFVAEVDAMNEAHPGIEDRVYTLDRWFDMLHFLLSEPRRRGTSDDTHTDPGTQAIVGATPLPDFLQGGQGHPIRYSPPADTARIAAWLDSLPPDSLRSAYDPDAMTRQSVYKFSQNRDDEVGTLARLLTYFEGLRAFYAAAAAHGEGVLTVVT